MWVLLGLIALCQADQPAAVEAFNTAIDKADKMLVLSPENYDSWDSKGLSLCGLALCENNKNRVLDAVRAFRKARSINRDQGHIKRTMRLLNSITQMDTADMLQSAKTALSEYVAV